MSEYDWTPLDRLMSRVHRINDRKQHMKLRVMHEPWSAAPYIVERQNPDNTGEWIYVSCFEFDDEAIKYMEIYAKGPTLVAEYPASARAAG